MKINLNSIRIREINSKDLKNDDSGLWFRKTKHMEYDAFLNPSLDILEFRRMSKNKDVIFSMGDIDYTDVFINVIINKDTPIDIYKYGLYEKDGEKITYYVEYKRSGSAAKNGKHLFIMKEFHEHMMNWTWMNRPPVFDNIQMSYVERKAYETLVNSTIKDVVVIDPKDILVLDDIKHFFMTNAALIGINSMNEPTLNRCVTEVENIVTDGECLIDYSVFGTMNNGMMLLRNFFFKSCGFRTDIQGYYKEIYGEEYETAEITDCWGFPIKVKNIKMIVTKSSFKLFKFNKYFTINQPEERMHQMEISKENNAVKKIPGFEYERDELLEIDDSFVGSSIDASVGEGFDLFSEWIDWVRRNDCIFGVVKNEEEHKENRKFTYQMINSMDFSEQDIENMLREDIEKYIELKTDDDAYEKYIGAGKDTGTDPTYTEYFLMKMVEKNPKFRQTKVYKDKKDKCLRAYLQRLYEGKITINANYRTLCSMPWELLQYSVYRDVEKIKPILQKNEVCILDIPEGEEVVLCRNPHTCASNVVYARNKIPEEIKKWFHFDRKNHKCNIVVISPWEWDVMAALNGADFDSDEVLCIREEIVIEKAKELMQNEIISSVPHEVKDDFNKKIEHYINDYENQRATDISLSNNKIGLISNYVQALNSYYWHSKRAVSSRASEPETLYDDIQILSVLTGLEIDKAKHVYQFDAGTIARKLVEKHIDYNAQKPRFMTFYSTSSKNKDDNTDWLECPMDYLAKKLFNLGETEERLSNHTNVSTVQLNELFDYEDCKGYDAKKVDAVLEKMESCIRLIRRYNINKKNLEWEENAGRKEETLMETQKLMNKNKIKLKDLKRILYIIFTKDVIDQMKNKNIKKGFIVALKVNNEHEYEYLLKDDRYKEVLANSDKQINYKKYKTLFEQFLEEKPMAVDDLLEFGKKIKKEKNEINLAYVIQTLNEKRKYGAVRDQQLMSLSLIYSVWPHMLEQCLKE